MRIALIGTGKTGQAIDRLAATHGHQVVARFNSENPLVGALSVDLNGAEMIIDFSRPELARPHIQRYCEWGVNAVIGTTGWYDSIDEVRRWVAAHNTGLLYAPNFSIGVAILSRLTALAAAMIESLPEYDVSIHETHHSFKVDSPSGTALHLANILTHGLTRKTSLATESQHQQIDPKALHVTSARVGHVFGRHDVTLDSPYDQIRIMHEAKGRDGFAAGALRAATWLQGRSGLFTLDDFLFDQLK